MSPDLWSLYAQMLRSRLFEEAIARLWLEGLISGEMHLGTGEEGIVAGVVSQLADGDALALDHRGTSPLLMRGVDPVLILRELLGRPDGLCRGRGGHMHLFAQDHLAASSGIVGSSGPAAVGFALAARSLRPGTIAVAFFGEAAVNQGMLMEAMNLAVAWRLPVLFVCKDDRWGITTASGSATGGSLRARAEGFGLRYIETDGRDAGRVWEAVHEPMAQVRGGAGPAFLHGGCVHLEGHFLGYQLLRAVRRPLKEMPRLAAPLTRAFLHPRGASLGERLSGMAVVTGALWDTWRDPRRDAANDPVVRARNLLLPELARLRDLEAAIRQEVDHTVRLALEEPLP